MNIAEEYEKGAEVCLRDAGGKLVPAELVEGPDSQGCYYWRILGRHQLLYLCHGERAHWFHADGSMPIYPDCHLVITKPAPETVEEVPEWAMTRACELIGMAKFDESLGEKAAMAFARYIAKHEKEPVDPLTMFAREIVANCIERTNAQRDAILEGRAGHAQTARVLETLHKRGVQIEGGAS